MKHTKLMMAGLTAAVVMSGASAVFADDIAMAGRESQDTFARQESEQAPEIGDGQQKMGRPQNRIENPFDAEGEMTIDMSGLDLPEDFVPFDEAHVLDGINIPENGELKPIEFDAEGNMTYGQRPEFDGERPERPDEEMPAFGGERPERPDGEMPAFDGERPELSDGGEFGQWTPDNGFFGGGQPEFDGERPERPDGEMPAFDGELPELPNGGEFGQWTPDNGFFSGGQPAFDGGRPERPEGEMTAFDGALPEFSENGMNGGGQPFGQGAPFGGQGRQTGGFQA